ncbi:MAG TPA: class II aldolase/adducin family protein [Spirochaetota bacterium]|nr:class II aldolase/adducin family protein [Spirochaetota bacterium]HPI89574.1 class II aldolase/adducin family protein [Spirochaetota bacterium]HPR49038.1 class II aldolase/adducin family protein [Spirochaetota bacterium]
MKKSVLPGYSGVKFKTIQSSEILPEGSENHIDVFKENGKKLLKYNMAPGNGGNISVRHKDGFLITASGSNLGCLEDDEIIYVEEYSINEKTVKFRGKLSPSSETFLHGLLYQEKPNIISVVHAHDEVATSMDLTNIIHETDNEEAYGSVELAHCCIDTFRKGDDLIVLKNHGYVSIGSSMDSATERIIAMHKQLLARK